MVPEGCQTATPMGPPTDLSKQSRFSSVALILVVAAITFLLAYDGGTFVDTSRDSLAIGVWWVVILAVGLGLLPLARFTRTALLSGGLLALFALLTLTSTIWADSAEHAFEEFNRASLYVGIFTLAALAATRSTLARWNDGIALGIVATAGLSLFSRCFPDVILTERNLHFLPLDFTRLSYPLEYSNGLAIFVALAVPLLLRTAVVARRKLLRALALAPFPALSAVILLTSSRGGVATAVIGALALLALAPYTRTVEAIVVAGIGSAAGIASVATRDLIVNHPGPDAAGQGHVAFALVLVSCAATAALYFLTLRYLSSRVARRIARVGRVWRRVAAGVVVLLIVGVVAAAHPVRVFDRFKRPPPALEIPLQNSKSPVSSHLLSAGSSGRWQHWASALDEFESAPALGRGAGSYEAWWAQHGSLRRYVRDAHSLYLETLGELGIAGFLLIVGAFLTGLVRSAHRVLASRREMRITIAALWTAFVAYVFAAGVDWMWEMTVVSVVGVAVLGLLVGRASVAETDGPSPLRRRWDVAGRGALVVVGLAVIAAQAVSLLTDRELQASKSAAKRGDIAAAVGRANDARMIEPWAASPYLQLALVSEQAGDYGAAEDWISKAIAHDPTDWRIWYLSARFETKLGNVVEARSRLRRAIQLNPKSALFAGR
jgi:tetratricopeptide (TPR) repeat protein